jgi:hypothetical protein
LSCNQAHPDHVRAERSRVLTDTADGPVIKTRLKVFADLECTRLQGHSGDHVGYRFSIVTPVSWPTSFEELVAMTRDDTPDAAAGEPGRAVEVDVDGAAVVPRISKVTAQDCRAIIDRCVCRIPGITEAELDEIIEQD